MRRPDAIAADDAAAAAGDAETFDDAAVLRSSLAALATVLVVDAEDAIPVASPSSSSLSSTNRRFAVADAGASAAVGAAAEVGTTYEEMVDFDSADDEGAETEAGSVVAAVVVGRTYEQTESAGSATAADLAAGEAAPVDALCRAEADDEEAAPDEAVPTFAWMPAGGVATGYCKF